MKDVNLIQNKNIAIIGVGLTFVSVIIATLVYLDNKRHSRIKLENEKLQKEINTIELALKIQKARENGI
jgi:hypothetical protein